MRERGADMTLIFSLCVLSLAAHLHDVIMRRRVEAAINRSDGVRDHTTCDDERHSLDVRTLGSFHRSPSNRLDHTLWPSFHRDFGDAAEQERVCVVELPPSPMRLCSLAHARVCVDHWFQSCEGREGHPTALPVRKGEDRLHELRVAEDADERAGVPGLGGEERQHHKQIARHIDVEQKHLESRLGRVYEL